MEGYQNNKGQLLMSENILDKLEKLTQESAKKRTSFLLAITKSSRSISSGARGWFESETDLLKKEMEILKTIMPGDVQSWESGLGAISARFKRALSYLDDIIDRAEKGKLTSIGEVRPKKKTTLFPEIPQVIEEKEEEKTLNLVSAILEVFDSASDLEKLVNEVERESKRTINTAKLVIKALQKR